MAIIQTFKKSFNKDKNIELIIKCSNSKIDKENLKKLKNQIKDLDIYK